jgi:hypothetical protein
VFSGHEPILTRFSGRNKKLVDFSVEILVGLNLIILSLPPPGGGGKQIGSLEEDKYLEGRQNKGEDE